MSLLLQHAPEYSCFRNRHPGSADAAGAPGVGAVGLGRATARAARHALAELAGSPVGDCRVLRVRIRLRGLAGRQPAGRSTRCSRRGAGCRGNRRRRQPAAGFAVPRRVMLSWYQGRRDDEQFTRQPVRPGEQWRFTVRLKRPHGNANPGGFDYEAWLLERNIRATGYVRPSPPQRLSEMVWRPDYAVERLRFVIRASFARLLPEDSNPGAGVLVALAVGDQKAINGDLWSTFNRTGTTHLMSISGLHVTMVAALFGWLVSFGWRRWPTLVLALPAQKAGLLAACAAALFYSLLAGFAVPAQRTLIMMLG